MERDPIIAEVISRAGGVSALSRALGIKHPAIYSWKQVPAARVPEVSRITGMSRHELRPDLYEAAQ